MNPGAPMTTFEMHVLLGGLLSHEPESAYLLSGCRTGGGSRAAALQRLVDAGLLEQLPSAGVGNRKFVYRLTPKGREFAETLQELEMLRESELEAESGST